MKSPARIPKLMVFPPAVRGRVIPWPVQPPEFALFDVGAIQLAAVVGGPLAGALLLAINDYRLKRMGRAAGIVGAGVGIAAVMVMMDCGWGIWMALAVVVGGSARALQGRAVDRHEEARGETGLWGQALLMSVGFLLAWVGYRFR